MSWKDVYSVKFDDVSVLLETTAPMEILMQPHSKGKHVTRVDDNRVGGNLLHAAHLSITFQSKNDLHKFRNGLAAMGTPGMLDDALSRPMCMDQRLDTPPSIDRRKALRDQSDPIGAFIRGDTLPLLRRRVEMYNATEPHRMHAPGCRSMKPGSGRPFVRECLACQGDPCPTCGQPSHLKVWIADNGMLETEHGFGHQTCPSTYSDPRMPSPLPERCLCESVISSLVGAS